MKVLEEAEKQYEASRSQKALDPKPRWTQQKDIGPTQQESAEPEDTHQDPSEQSDGPPKK